MWIPLTYKRDLPCGEDHIEVAFSKTGLLGTIPQVLTPWSMTSGQGYPWRWTAQLRPHRKRRLSHFNVQVFEDSPPPAVREVVQTNEICDGGGFDSAAQLGIESYGECGGRVWPLSAAPRSSCHPAMRLACPTKPPSLLLCANCCLPDQLCGDPSFHPTEKNARLAMPMQWSVTDHWVHCLATQRPP